LGNPKQNIFYNTLNNMPLTLGFQYYLSKEQIIISGITTFTAGSDIVCRSVIFMSNY